MGLIGYLLIHAGFQLLLTINLYILNKIKINKLTKQVNNLATELEKKA